MAYIGKKPAEVALTASDITDGIITKAKLDSSIDAINYKNILINGDMQIAQRSASASSITGAGYHAIDRFQWIPDYGTVTLSQDTDVPTGQGFTKSFKADVTTAGSVLSGGAVIIRQKVEGQMLQHLKKGTSSAESLTLSFWIKSTKTGTYIAELYDADNTRQISKSYTVDSTNTWEKKEITFAGDTTGAYGNDNAASLFVNLWLSAGTDYTSGTLSTTWTSSTNTNRVVGQVDAQDSTSNNIYVTGIQLEVGDTATDFEFLPTDVNLKRCQRYYYLHSGEIANNKPIGIGYYYNASYIGVFLGFPTTMRNSPSTVAPNASNYFKFDRDGGNDQFDTLATEIVSVNWVQLYHGSGSGTQGVAGSVRTNNASSYLAFESEL
jgi:hypothetical protein